MIQVVRTPLRVPRPSDLLVATPRLVDPNFDRTVVFVIEHQAAGTLGVVINRDSEVACASAVPRWANRFAEGASVGIGGPVEPQGLLALGATGAREAAAPRSATDAEDDATGAGGAWRPLGRGVGLVDLSADPLDLDPHVAAVRIYGGHAGWGAGQLRSELEAGCWWVFESEPGDLIAAPTLWYDVLERQPAPACLLARYPESSSLN